MTESAIRILYVEDDELDQIAFKRFIDSKRLNYVVDVTDSVKKAKEYLLINHYDALLLDYNLSDGTAFDIIKDVDAVSIILLTGFGDEQIAAQSIKLGAYDYLVKDTDGTYLNQLPDTIALAIRETEKSIKAKEHFDEIERLVLIRTQELYKEIEERKRAEQALLQINNELEERVQKRTELLQQSFKELSEAQNQLISSEKIITENRLMNNLSQKLNTPIGTNITLTSYLLSENKKIKEYFETGKLTPTILEDYLLIVEETMTEIQNNLNASSNLVKKFKEFNRKKLTDELVEFHLDTLVHEVIQLLSTKLTEKQITVNVLVSKNLVLYKYPNVFRHIFFNLFMHVIVNQMAGKLNNVVIRARLEHEQLVIEYEDSLEHIPYIDLSAAFDTFYMLNQETRSPYYVELNTVYMLIQEIEKGVISINANFSEGNHITIAIPIMIEFQTQEIELDALMHKK